MMADWSTGNNRRHIGSAKRYEEACQSRNHVPDIYVRNLWLQGVPKTSEGQKGVDFSCSDPLSRADFGQFSPGSKAIPSFSRN